MLYTKYPTTMAAITAIPIGATVVRVLLGSVGDVALSFPEVLLVAFVWETFGIVVVGTTVVVVATVVVAGTVVVVVMFGTAYTASVIVSTIGR